MACPCGSVYGSRSLVQRTPAHAHTRGAPPPPSRSGSDSKRSSIILDFLYEAIYEVAEMLCLYPPITLY